ncbi:recombinase family protein [Ammoniphilus sp. CFH 90114]|uniref:recombinase family protein n=1 Tax=Ammoniphilus sp. CFH 90114 TaxID=2493665 RepID=UPI00100E9F23|nr:recombinase family protein [Ammoniphilus sp. CFH 90114]RXT08846.1 recombinase family protein [Ammoniphilus sp. CFH 90114]
MLARAVTDQFKKVAIYVHGNSVEAEDKNSGSYVKDQLELIREWCREHGYEVYKEYVDYGIRGNKPNTRKTLEELIADAETRSFNMVVVWKAKDVSRRILQLCNTIGVFYSNNITFRSISDSIETETPTGVLNFHMMTAIAEYDSNSRRKKKLRFVRNYG